MTSGEMITWIYDHTDDADYKSKEALIDNIKADTKGYAKTWVEKEGHTTKGKRVYDAEIQTKIDDINKGYINRIRSEIDGANTEPEVRGIDIDSNYESDTTSQLESLKSAKMEGISLVTESISDISAARTIEEIDTSIAESPSTGSVRKWSPELASELGLAIATAAERKYDLEHL